MSSRSPVLCVVTTYLLIASLVTLTWLGLRVDAGMPSWALFLGLTPPVLYLAIALPARGRSQFFGRSTACLGFFPVLLLMWASERADDVGSVPSTNAATTLTGAVNGRSAANEWKTDLDLARLFGGALSTADAPLQLGGLLMMRRAAFADGSELSFYRFESRVHAGAYLTFLSRARNGSAARLANRQGTRLSPEAARYVYMEQHGRDLLQVDAESAAQALARLEAQSVQAPEPSAVGPLDAQADSRDATLQQEAGSARPMWPFMLGACVIHMLAFVGFIAWVGTHGTRVAGAVDGERVSDDRLRARLSSLQELGVPFSIGASAREAELVVEYQFDPGSARRHNVFLVVDAQRGEVRVRERTNARGAAPRDESERDMRSLGAPRFDPTRPDAQKVWSIVAQTSILEPEELRAVPLTLREDRAELPRDYVESIDPDRMIYVLCAVVTRSGFCWQPEFT